MKKILHTTAMRLGGGVMAACLLSACGSTPGAPTPTTPVTPAIATPAPAPVVPAIQKADMELAAEGTTICRTGFCSSFTTTVTDLGPGCATHLAVLVRWVGGDGKQLPNTPDIQMGALGAPLSAHFFRPGETLIIQSLAGFNDVRSANTHYTYLTTWDNVACQ